FPATGEVPMFISWMRSRLASKGTRKQVAARPQARLELEGMEERVTPAAFPQLASLFQDLVHHAPVQQLRSELRSTLRAFRSQIGSLPLSDLRNVVRQLRTDVIEHVKDTLDLGAVRTALTNLPLTALRNTLSDLKSSLQSDLEAARDRLEAKIGSL